MMFMAVAMSGMGDGAGGNAQSYPVALLSYIPSVYLLSLFVFCFRFIKDSDLDIAALVSYALLAVSIIILFLIRAIVVVLPLIGFAYAAHRLLFTTRKNAD